MLINFLTGLADIENTESSQFWPVDLNIWQNPYITGLYALTS